VNPADSARAIPASWIRGINLQWLSIPAGAVHHGASVGRKSCRIDKAALKRQLFVRGIAALPTFRWYSHALLPWQSPARCKRPGQKLSDLLAAGACGFCFRDWIFGDPLQLQSDVACGLKTLLRVFLQHVLTTRSNAGGVNGCSCRIGAGSFSKIALATLIWLFPSNGRRPSPFRKTPRPMRTHPSARPLPCLQFVPATCIESCQSPALRPSAARWDSGR